MQGKTEMQRKAEIYKAKSPARSPITEMQQKAEIYKKRGADIRGFSLTELLTVAGVMGVLAAIAIPSYVKYTRSVEKRVVYSDASAIARAFMTCSTETDDFGDCDELSDLNVSGSGSVEWTDMSADPYFCVQHSITRTSGDVCSFCLQIHKDEDEINKENGGPANCWEKKASDPSQTYTANTNVSCDTAGKCIITP